jgi:hypothetical protein
MKGVGKAGKLCLSPAGNDSCEILNTLSTENQRSLHILARFPVRRNRLVPSMSPIATDRRVRTRNESCLQLDTNAFLAASDNRF